MSSDTLAIKLSALHPDVFWYPLNDMGAQKVLVTFFLYVFHVKTK